MIKLDLTKAYLREDLNSYQSKVSEIHDKMETHSGDGNEFDSWMYYHDKLSKEELHRIVECAKNIRENAEVFLICGIGGSSLGAKAAIDMVNGIFPKPGTKMIFIGNTFSSMYIKQILDYIREKSIYINVISKSGGTIETSIAFRLVKELMQTKYSEKELKERIIITTDANSGLLRDIGIKYEYQMFQIPDGIGGRFSAMTPVGLLPMAVAGLNICEIMNGFRNGQDEFSSEYIEDNIAYQYAVARRILDKHGDEIELFVTYEMQLAAFGEWWKQLFAESEGKNTKGIFPACANFSSDLHSIGQYIQDGKRILFETSLLVKNNDLDVCIPYDKDNLDNLNYIANMSLNDINKTVSQATLVAHSRDAGVPNITITIDRLDEYCFGHIIYFFFRACAMSVYLLDENPFNQPGVEVYKKHMKNFLTQKDTK